ncbi:MAG: DUF2911 domain-containing protein [Betaproteobacteria bacterium]
MRTAAFALVVSIAMAGCAAAQGRRASPHETTSATIDGARITISYGRPYRRGRTIMGGLVPYGRVWATGADEATTISTTKTLRIGGVDLPAGNYSLWTLPSPDRWKLIVNRQTGQWHTQYDRLQDLARLDMTKRQLARPVDQLTISIGKGSTGGGVLTIAWETTEVSIPFAVE